MRHPVSPVRDVIASDLWRRAGAVVASRPVGVECREGVAAGNTRADRQYETSINKNGARRCFVRRFRI